MFAEKTQFGVNFYESLHKNKRFILIRTIVLIVGMNMNTVSEACLMPKTYAAARISDGKYHNHSPNPPAIHVLTIHS